MIDGRRLAPQSAVRPARSAPDCFWLWIDGVGGYLVCQGDELVIGQPLADKRVDIPLLGDLSRRHARIVRQGDQYLLESDRPVRIAGRLIEGRGRLASGNLVELGHGVQLRFTRGHPLSATARLDFVSVHRTQPRADAVLLLAETCVLGPAATSHVVCPGWSSEVIVYRAGDGLHVRSSGEMEIDGAPAATRGALSLSSRVVGRDFSFSLEPM